MLKHHSATVAWRAMQALVLILACGNVRADCLSQQLSCLNRCIAVNVRDTACTARCGARAEACLQREADKDKPDGDEDQPSVEDDASDSPSPPATQVPSRPSQAKPPASQYDSTDASSCYEPFYDPKSYNWLAIKNKCSTGIHVTWKCRSCPEKLGSSADIPPGQVVGAGLSREEVERKGGMSYAACREGYRAVDINGDSWRGSTLFSCRKR